jgi:hypothetical protein
MKPGTSEAIHCRKYRPDFYRIRNVVNDSAVNPVPENAVLEENFLRPLSDQTAVLFVFVKFPE